jgi:hypothetical protein
VGDIAVEVQVQSRVLVAARVATGARRRTRVRRAEAEAQAADWAVPVGGAAPPTGSAAAGDSLGLLGPFEARLRGIGVASARLLERAAALDRSGQRIISEAATGHMDRRGPSAGAAEALDAEQVVGSRPAAAGRRAAVERQRAFSAESEPEAEP